MLQPTGSVYLDAPRTTSRRPQPKPDVPRNPRIVAAGVLGAIGIIALTLAALLGAASVLINDPDTLPDTIDAALDDPDVRPQIEAELATAIRETLFDDELTARAARFDIDVENEVATLAPAMLDDPTFRAALTDLIAETHARILLEPSDAPIELAPLTNAALAVIDQEQPRAAALLPADNVLFVVTPDQIPDLTGPVGMLDRGLVALAVAGLALPLAGLVHPRRHRVMAWTGRWLLVMGLVAACLAVGLPYIGEQLTGYSIVEVSIRALSGRLLAPAAIAGVVGMGFTAVASILKSRDKSSATDEGAAAALGVDEPVFDVIALSPQMELAQRGLVDVSHPLTNI